MCAIAILCMVLRITLTLLHLCTEVQGMQTTFLFLNKLTFVNVITIIYVFIYFFWHAGFSKTFTVAREQTVQPGSMPNQQPLFIYLGQCLKLMFIQKEALKIQSLTCICNFTVYYQSVNQPFFFLLKHHDR